MTLKELLVGFGTQVRSIWMIGLHAFAKRETRMYPEEPVYLPPRYRGRIVLTRDPDGEERCVACNLCAVACPVGCITLQKAETKDGRWSPEFFRINFSRCRLYDCSALHPHALHDRRGRPQPDPRAAA